MKSFCDQRYKTISVGEDTMMSTYKVIIQGTYAGKDASGTYQRGLRLEKTEGGMAGYFHTT